MLQIIFDFSKIVEILHVRNPFDCLSYRKNAVEISRHMCPFVWSEYITHLYKQGFCRSIRYPDYAFIRRHYHMGIRH